MVSNKIHNELGKLRRSMVVLTSGPGSIVDFRADGAPVSAVIAGLEEWDHSFPLPPGEQRVSEPRLQRRLGVSEFRLPPVIDERSTWRGSNDTRSLVAVRFPIWLQCPRCDRLAPSYRWGNDPRKAYRYCPHCTERNLRQQHVPVIPVRFVMACEAGHLDEFPWDWWVNHKPECTNRNNLFLRSERPGIAGLIVRCPVCGASRSMDGIFNATTWRGFRCNGRRPWLRTNSDTCDLQPRALQRGASNLYFPVRESALSIPPWSDPLQSELGIYWDPIIKTDPDDRSGFIGFLARSHLKPILNDLKLTPEELANIIEQRVNQYSGDAILNIKHEEYQHFVAGFDIRHEEGGEFEIRNVKMPDVLKSYFNRIVRVVRLREVMALRGFTRINPPGDEHNQNIAPISMQRLDWLPAIEVRGEGLFLELDPERLRVWEQQREIRHRTEIIRAGWQQEWKDRYGEGEPSPKITARYLLIHTYAHALMRQLNLECGYSSASLRERIYSGEEGVGMAGLLIYTATSDSDGTLGGLQRQGEPSRISRTAISAVKAMEWCSSDPLCIERLMTPESYSLAACHACCLVPETSCEQYNRFLDRAMMVGHPDRPDVGFFSSLLRRSD